MATAWQTLEGRQAQQVLDWVNGDPARRAGEGIDRLAKIGGDARTTAGLHEVQDVARVVARLASPLAGQAQRGGWDPARHPRIPHGHGGGEFAHVAGLTADEPTLEARDLLAGVIFAEPTPAVRTLIHRGQREMARLLGTDKTAYGGRVQVIGRNERQGVGGEMDWDGTLRLREQYVAALQAGEQHPDWPVREADAYNVLLHELIHGAGCDVKRPGDKAFPDEVAYNEQYKANIEEGFTELGAAYLAPQWLKALGVADRPLGGYMSPPGPPNPAWLKAKREAADGVRKLGQRLKDEAPTGHRGVAEWKMGNRLIEAASKKADDPHYLTVDLDDALSVADKVPWLSAETTRLREAIAAVDRIPERVPYTLGQWAQTRGSPENIAEGTSWGHYTGPMSLAQGWCQRIAMAERGMPFEHPARLIYAPLHPELYGRMRELADEVNRTGNAEKPLVLARQLLRANKIKDRPRAVSGVPRWERPAPGARKMLSESVADIISAGWPTGLRDSYDEALKWAREASQ